MRFKCTMGLRNTLIVMALLLSVYTRPQAKKTFMKKKEASQLRTGAASLKSHAFFNETGELPCYFPNTQNLSLDELVIFWQDQNKLVLYELFKGQEKPNNVHPKYIGRTSFDQDSWTLRLHNVQIKDTGSYQCFIHHRRSQGLVSIHQMSSDLIVLANFSQPEISLIANQTEKSNIINLTCSSTQGYPEPQRMYVHLNTTNSTSTYDAVMKKSQNNITELYNVSISVSFPIPPETNVTIFCALQLEPTKIILSQPYNIEIIKVEEKESEQTEKRVELQEPERSDEVQCDVNISKTASDNKSATDF
ncbi:T-lymphocyte activation antigen CD86 isoform X5 [Bubalus kerabau]|uniref:T-lymphocyte activation antigen CD86 isoform X5 n=1 Tax=Bubalus carabanensis TaxID=3119969 RepID=UPI00244EEAEB|nr:T-lymphocyte activation antigen CD86 isoform X5 [Bubalus carabanensis]